MSSPDPSRSGKSAGPARGRTSLRAGAARCSISPPVGSRLIGNPLHRLASGVRDKLGAQVLVLKAATEQMALISLDLLAVDTQTVSRIAGRIQTLTGIPAGSVLVSATHTHTGPAVVEIFGEDVDGDYLDWLVDQVAKVTASAVDRMTEAAVGVASGEVGELCFNRRLLQRQGGISLPTHTTYDPDQVIGPEGPTDPELTILRVDRCSDGSTLALWLVFASHTDTVTGDLISADYPAYVYSSVRAAYADELNVQFNQGASGNLVPFDPADLQALASRKATPFYDAAGSAKARRYGRVLAARVLQIAPAIETLPGGPLVAPLEREVEAVTRSVSRDQLAQAKATLESSTSLDWEKVIAREVLWVDEHAGHRERLPVRAAVVGDLAIVTVPGELFVEHGLAIKEASPFPRTAVVTLTGGYFGYLPTRRAFENGGYETKPARSSRLDEAAGKRVVEAARELLAQLWQGLPGLSAGR